MLRVDLDAEPRAGEFERRRQSHDPGAEHRDARARCKPRGEEFTDLLGRTEAQRQTRPAVPIVVHQPPIVEQLLLDANAPTPVRSLANDRADRSDTREVGCVEDRAEQRLGPRLGKRGGRRCGGRLKRSAARAGKRPTARREGGSDPEREEVAAGVRRPKARVGDFHGAQCAAPLGRRGRAAGTPLPSEHREA